MKFGPVATTEAEGAILAHAVSLKSGRLKKGHVLRAEDVSSLVSMGKTEVIVARLEDDDIAENEAAAFISKVLVNEQIRAEPAFTGRVNLYATATGLFQADRAAIDAMNRIDPAITIATLANDSFVEKGRMVGTVKIIPFAASRCDVEAVRDTASKTSPLDIATFEPKNVGLIQTELPTLKKSVLDKTARVLFDRLEDVQCILAHEERVPHGSGLVSSAMRSMIDRVGLIIVFGASAIADRRDVIPAAIEQAGGKVNYFGMPVDPGNLLLIGELQGKPVIGAPGCARSPVENGFDWVLHRVIAGLPVDPSYLSGLGVGGLLMEIGARPQPREG